MGRLEDHERDGLGSKIDERAVAAGRRIVLTLQYKKASRPPRRRSPFPLTFRGRREPGQLADLQTGAYVFVVASATPGER